MRRQNDRQTTPRQLRNPSRVADRVVDEFQHGHLFLRARQATLRHSRVELVEVTGSSALGKLESAVQGVGVRASEEATKLRSEREGLDSQLTTLNANHASLNDRLVTVQASYTELEQTINQVTKRLDATIGQLKSVLD